jgi:hypothetical protein
MTEQEILAAYSTPGLRRCELSHSAKKAHLATLRRPIIGEEAEKVLAELYPDCRDWRTLPLDSIYDEFDVKYVTVRVANCLATAGIKTLGQLAEASDVELLSIPHFGADSLRYVKALLAAAISKHGTCATEPRPWDCAAVNQVVR